MMKGSLRKKIDVLPLAPFQTIQVSENNDKILELLQAFAHDFSNTPHKLFGQEIRLAGAIEYGKVTLVSPCEFQSSSHFSFKLPNFFLRPAIEPIAYNFWHQIPNTSSHSALVKELGSCLIGKAVDYRENSVISSPDSNGVFFRYPIPDKNIPLINKYQSWIMEMPINSFEACLWKYFNFLAFHPLRDGNGRTARVILLNDISQLIGGPFLSLPIGVVLYVWMPIYLHCIQSLSLAPHESWQTFVLFMRKVFKVAVKLADIQLNTTPELNTSDWGLRIS